MEHQKFKDIIVLYTVAFMGGFCLGFIGVGTALFLVLALNKMNIAEGGIRSISATLPLILSIVTGTGALIQILMGSIDVYINNNSKGNNIAGTWCIRVLGSKISKPHSD